MDSCWVALWRLMMCPSSCALILQYSVMPIPPIGDREACPMPSFFIAEYVDNALENDSHVEAEGIRTWVVERRTRAAVDMLAAEGIRTWVVERRTRAAVDMRHTQVAV